MIKTLNFKTRISHPVSKLLRPWFEKHWIKSALGGGFAVTTLATSLMVVPMEASQALADYHVEILDQSIETKKSMAVVLPENTGVSQGYHGSHPGIDITAKLGAKIYPLKSGVVIKIENAKWNYGRAVWVDHGNGSVTLYAHMGKIYVEEGESVNIDKPLGEVGLTGRTTGPHLHFEIRRDNSLLNPMPYIVSSKK